MQDAPLTADECSRSSESVFNLTDSLFNFPESVFTFPESVFSLLRNPCSPSPGIGVHVRPEYARDEKSRVVVKNIRDWAIKQRGSPQSGLRKAIDYMFRLWPGLTRFLDNPAVGLDNNATERALRGVVLGRKNHYGSRSERGTRVAALFYSLIDTAKLCGADPKAYLRCAAKAGIDNPGTAILPHDLVSIDAESAA